MSRFWPPIFHCVRSNSWFVSQFWNDNYKPNGFIWPDSLVLCALSRRDFQNPKSKAKHVSQHRASFRDNTITQYENRLRRHSNPMKVFRYFATIKMKTKAGKTEVYMTPQDFLRSILPGMRQPERLTLDRFRLIDEDAAKKLQAGVKKDSIFLKLEEKALIGFSDYVLLTLLLAIPKRHVRLGLAMLDLDEDGTVGIAELEHILGVISMGKASMMNSHLKGHLFGSRLKRRLSIHEIMEFLQKLNNEILVLEYEMLRKEHKTVITELDFAKVVLANTERKRKRSTALERVKQKFGKEKIGISLDEFMSFFELVQDMETVDMALTFHFLSGAGIRPETLQQIAQVVSGVKLSPHLVDVIFAIFDNDGDGIIRRQEFIQTLRDNLRRVHHRKHLRLTTGICILGKCCWKTLPFWRARRVYSV